MIARPIRVGPPGRRLFAMHHPPAGGAATGHAVLLCNPFGQEAIRCHRLFKVLAERFARAGVHAMRFDYACTGDSDGDDADGSLEGWIGDVAVARGALQQASGGATASLFGLRLGGTLAMLASARMEPVHRIVAWDPVVSGRAYVDDLAAAHAAALAADGFDIAVPDAQAMTEALGFPFPPELRRAMEAVDAASLAALRAERVAIVASPGAADIEALRATLAARVPVSVHGIASEVSWASDEAMNSAIVPADGIQAVLDAVAAP